MNETKVEVRIKFPLILFTCPIHLAMNASRVSTDCRFDNRMKCWKAPFGAKQLINLRREFSNIVIVEGQEYIDRLKVDLLHMTTAKMMYGQTGTQEITLADFSWYKFKIPPFKHQLKGLYYYRAFDGAAMFADCGCLSGDSIVRFNRGGKSGAFTLKDAYLRFNGLDHRETWNWDNTIPTRVRSHKDDHIGLHWVSEIKESGVKEVFQVKLSDGKSLKATADHEFLTTEGFVRLSSLSASSMVCVDNLSRHQKKLVKVKKTKVSDPRRAVGKYHKYANFEHGIPEFSRVVSIDPCGEEMTYDIVCEDPYRNFVANGIVVHNSGKSAMTLWDIDMKYREGKLKKNSVLVVGKLMTLFSGWNDDTSQFTYLDSQVLWDKPQSKIIKGESVTLGSYGTKPKGKAKYYEETKIYFKSTGKEAILKSSVHFKADVHVRKVRKWKQVGDVKYGEETLTSVENINLRSQRINQKIRDGKFAIDIINHEGLLFFEEELLKRKYEYVIFDESTVIKSPRGKIFLALCRIAAHSKFRRILSGTPSPQGPQDLWSQFFFLDNGITLGSNYKEFLNENFDIINFGSGDSYAGSKPVIRPHLKNGLIGTQEFISHALTNRVFRCKLRECTDLPPLIEEKLDVFLPPDLQKHYDKMESDLQVELADRTIEVNIALSKLGKLRQIASGFIIDSRTENKQVIRLSKSNPKMEVLKEWLNGIRSDEKVVIFATFKEEIELLLREFGKEAVSIYGGTSSTNKLANQVAFVNDPKVRFIICQPSSAAYGVNKLTVARYMVFYSIDYRSDTIYQAIHRIQRTGQQRSMFVYYLLARGTIDEIMYKAVQVKDRIQQKTIEINIVNEFLKEG